MTTAVLLKGAHSTRGHDGNGMRTPEKWVNSAGRNKRDTWQAEDPGAAWLLDAGEPQS